MRLLGILAAVCCLVGMVACGGGSSSSSTSTITVVGASCNPTSIASGQTSQCTASVSGTGSFSSTVSWTASGNGTITPAGGLFTAATVPFTTTVTITATSTQDTTKSGSTIITVATAGTVNSVTATCNPSSIQSGQLTACTAVVDGTGNFSPNVTWTASAGNINPITGVYTNTTPGTYTVTATSQQDPTKTGTSSVSVANGVNNVLPVVVDAGPTGNYANGVFATVIVCTPGTTTCQTIDHVLVDTGSVGLRLLAQGAAGGLLDPTAFPLQTDGNGNAIGQCNQFVDGYTWGSVSLAMIQMAGETASTVPNATVAGVPIQIIGDPRIPSAPSSCSSVGVDESNLAALGAYGVLGVGNFEQDCGPGCVSGTSAPNVYYSCASGTCSATFQGLPQQVTNPAWVLPADNNGVLVQLPSIPSGGTTTVTGNLIFGIGTQTNNSLGSATVFNTDANAYFTTIFNGQTNSCSYIDSGSNAIFFPSAGYPGLITCSGGNSAFYCPASLLTLSASNQSAPVQNQPQPPANQNSNTGTAGFNVGNANTLFGNNNGQNNAFSELGGPNAPISGCGNSFDWGLSFFYGKNVFTGIEQQPVTGTSYVGPFWAY
ncbi:MAG TPA: DUF3443 family protein [Candidatus Eisenbacteria bacterium]|nr:DUF3443 family protein [Candidatus Eisenbacteria bacterium]